MLVSPLQDFLRISTLVPRAEIRNGCWVALGPVEEDEAGIGMAHQYLPKHLDAVIYG
jgi:hypothetical protein